jgi:uncharacterized protein YceK
MHKEVRASFRALMLLALAATSLLGSGCSSLRPPAEDRAVWLQQQEVDKPSPDEKNPANLLYPLISGIGTAFGH